MTRGLAAAPLVIVVEPIRTPGEMVWRPWQTTVRCPGKADEPGGRRWTREGAIAAGRRVAGHLASGRPYVVVVL